MQKYDEIDSFEFGQQNPPEMFRTAPKAPTTQVIDKVPSTGLVAPYKPTWKMTVDELILAEETN